MEDRTEKQKYIQTVIAYLNSLRRSERDAAMFAALMGIEPPQLHLLDLIAAIVNMKHKSILELLKLRPEWRSDMMVALLARAIKNCNRSLLKVVSDGLTVDEIVPSLVQAVNILHGDIARRYGWIEAEKEPDDWSARFRAKRNQELSELAMGIQYTLSSSNPEWKKRRQEILDKLDGRIMADLAAYELGAAR